MREVLGAEESQCWDDAVLGVCFTWCMKYSVYAILGVKSRLWHGEIERDDSTLYS